MGYTFNEEVYRSRLQNGFSWLLESDFVNTDVYSLSDEEVMSFIENKTRVLKEEGTSLDCLEPFKDFCTLVANKGHACCEWMNCKYLAARLGFGQKDEFISYRLFKKACMQPVISKNDRTFAQDCASVYCYNRIFNIPCSIEDFFNEPSDTPLLYLYSFEAQDDYIKTRKCFRFFSLNSNMKNLSETIREKIVQSQSFALRHMLKYPVLHTLPYRATLWPELRNYFVDFLDCNYRSKIEEKYNFIKNIMAIHHISELDPF